MRETVKKSRRSFLERFPSIVFGRGNPRKLAEKEDNPLRLRNFSMRRIILRAVGLLAVVEIIGLVSGQYPNPIYQPVNFLLGIAVGFFLFTMFAIMLEVFTLIGRHNR